MYVYSPPQLVLVTFFALINIRPEKRLGLNAKRWFKLSDLKRKLN